MDFVGVTRFDIVLEKPKNIALRDVLVAPPSLKPSELWSQIPFFF